MTQLASATAVIKMSHCLGIIDLLIICHRPELEYTKTLFYTIAFRPLANIQHFLFYVLYFSVLRALDHLCPYWGHFFSYGYIFDLRPLFQEQK